MERRPHLLIPLGLIALFVLTPGIVNAQDAGGASDVFVVHKWLPWVIVATIGAAAGATELIAKYRDEPGRALVTGPALLYIAVNALASLVALFLIRELDWDFGVNPEQVGLVQIIVAGFGAMIILRAAVFTIRAPGQEAMVGPVNVLQTILKACDRAVDRKRASERAAEVSKLMHGLSFDRAVIELPVVSLALMQSLSNEEQSRLRDGVDALRGSELSNEGKCLSLGLVLIGTLGEDALQAAIATVKERIKWTESLAPVIDFMHPLSISAEASAGGADIPLVLSGQNFDSTSRVLLNGDVLVTEFNPMTRRLTAMLPVATLNTLPEHQVAVFTRTNNAGESAPALLRLEGSNPIPDLSSIEPAAISAETVAAGGEITLTASGSDFVDGAEVRIDGQTQQTSFVSDQALTAAVKADVLATPGEHKVTVFNPPPLGGESTAALVLMVAATGEPDVVVPTDPGAPPTPPDGAAGAAVPPVGDAVGTAEVPPGEGALPAEPLTAEAVTVITATEAEVAATNGAEAAPSEPLVSSPSNP